MLQLLLFENSDYYTNKKKCFSMEQEIFYKSSKSNQNDISLYKANYMRIVKEN